MTELSQIRRNVRRRIKYQSDDRYLLRVCFDNMKQRCYNSNSTVYPRYGERGIIICQEWLDNPDAFIDWALMNGFQRGLEIDRINNNEGYSPENCRWITHKMQMMNTHNNITNLKEGTRICWKCKRELPLTVFSADKSDIAGRCRICKECDKERQKEGKKRNWRKKLDE